MTTSQAKKLKAGMNVKLKKGSRLAKIWEVSIETTKKLKPYIGYVPFKRVVILVRYCDTLRYSSKRPAQIQEVL